MNKVYYQCNLFKGVSGSLVINGEVNKQFYWVFLYMQNLIQYECETYQNFFFKTMTGWSNALMKLIIECVKVVYKLANNFPKRWTNTAISPRMTKVMLFFNYKQFSYSF